MADLIRDLRAQLADPRRRLDIVERLGPSSGGSPGGGGGTGDHGALTNLDVPAHHPWATTDAETFIALGTAMGYTDTEVADALLIAATYTNEQIAVARRAQLPGLTLWTHSWGASLSSDLSLRPVVTARSLSTPWATARERTWPQLLRTYFGLPDSLKTAVTQELVSNDSRRFPFYVCRRFGVIGWARYTPVVTLTGATVNSRLFSIMNMTARDGGNTFFQAYTHRKLLANLETWTTGIQRDGLGREARYLPDATFVQGLVGFSLMSRMVRVGSVIAFESLFTGGTGLLDPGGIVECEIGEEFQVNGVSGAVLARAYANHGGWSAIDVFHALPEYAGRDVAGAVANDYTGKYDDSPLWGNLDVLLLGQNDFGAFSQTDWKESLRFAFAKLSLFHEVNDIDPAITYNVGTGGTWTAVVAPTNTVGAEWTAGGTYHRYTGGTAGYLEFSTGAGFTGGPLDLCFVALRGSLGGTATILIDGAAPNFAGGVRINGGTSDQVITNNVTTYDYNGGVTRGIPIVKRITGLPAGNHVVRVRIDSLAASGQFIFNWWGLEARNPPKPIVFCNQPVNAFPGFYATPTNDANVTTFNGWSQDIIDEFPAGQVHVADLYEAFGHPIANTALYNADGVHPNDRGHAVIASVVRDTINRIPPSQL